MTGVLAIAGMGLLQACSSGSADNAEADKTPEAQESGAERQVFGTLDNGTEVEEVTLTNGEGMSVSVMTLGASLHAINVPDAKGNVDDVLLGFDTPQEYLDNGNFYGATVGRFANRIAKGQFSLDGKAYQLDVNDGPNSLHGGKDGIFSHVWKIAEVTEGDTPSVTMTYRSPDGESGYPGNADITATYALSKDNKLTITYKMTSDKPTLANISSHGYFNLAGVKAHKTAMDEVLTIDASHYTPVDDTLIPTGERAPVDGTVFDFREGKVIGKDVRQGDVEQLRLTKGFDHNFVIDGKAGDVRRMARLEDPESGRVMEVWSSAPALQFYSGNFIAADFVGKNNVLYRQGDAVALEPQLFPDAPNHPDFPSARLDPGQEYRNTIQLKFSTDTGK
ncbi:galactose mutarotase [Altericroceibacterium spongiae]|uniref:Aldose 1-epimerase n=2 Tax=Altericroceibacterium spongiae TaxID=2320269 RepID=A0A420EAF7_9SPHN|nr:galactose mutarotase [Altericroceibacterium spongiae]